jgi:prepilin signal peptidase PulO-like enzyme (type II secretory pathway)
MLMHKILTALLWVLAAFVLFALCAVWIIDAQSGMVSAWVILPFFWSAAILSVLGRYLAQWRDPVIRYLARHKPLAGPGAGAELPH